jgi:hypothetical protein
VWWVWFICMVKHGYGKQSLKDTMGNPLGPIFYIAIFVFCTILLFY